MQLFPLSVWCRIEKKERGTREGSNTISSLDINKLIPPNIQRAEFGIAQSDVGTRRVGICLFLFLCFAFVVRGGFGGVRELPAHETCYFACGGIGDFEDADFRTSHLIKRELCWFLCSVWF